MKNAINVLVAVTALGAVALGTYSLIGTKEQQELVAADTRRDTRTAYINGDCGALGKRCIDSQQIDGMCICYVDENAKIASDEIGANSTPKDLYRMIWCDNKIHWQRMSEDIGSCHMIAENLPGTVSLSKDGAMEEQLNRICSPCRVSASSWGHCPHCVFDVKRYPRGCAGVCRDESQE